MSIGVWHQPYLTCRSPWRCPPRSGVARYRSRCSRPRHGSHGILSQSPDSSEGKRIVCAADSCYQGALELIRKTSQATSVGIGAVGLCLEKERWHRSGSPYKIKMGWSWSGGAAGRTHCLCLNALEALEVQLRSTTCGHSLRSIGSVFDQCRRNTRLA